MSEEVNHSSQKNVTVNKIELNEEGWGPTPNALPGKQVCVAEFRGAGAVRAVGGARALGAPSGRDPLRTY